MAKNLSDEIEIEGLTGGIVLEVGEEATEAFDGFREETQEKDVFFGGAEIEKSSECVKAEIMGGMVLAVFVDLRAELIGLIPPGLNTLPDRGGKSTRGLEGRFQVSGHFVAGCQTHATASTWSLD